MGSVKSKVVKRLKIQTYMKRDFNLFFCFTLHPVLKLIITESYFHLQRSPDEWVNASVNTASNFNKTKNKVMCTVYN